MMLLCAETLERDVKRGRKNLNKLYYSLSIKTVNLLPLPVLVKYVNILPHTYCNLSSYNSINGH